MMSGGNIIVTFDVEETPVARADRIFFSYLWFTIPAMLTIAANSSLGYL